MDVDILVRTVLIVVEQVTENVLRIQVKKRKSRTGFIGAILRFFLALAGVLFVLFGALLMATIIGFFPGLGAMGMGAGMIAGAFRRQRVKCPACDKQVNVVIGAEDFECPRCKKVTIVDWEE